MWNRIFAIVRAHLSGEWIGKAGANLPVAPLLFHGFMALTLCGIARSELPPFGYAVFALSIPLALTTLPLLGELGPLLRADAAAEWIGAQPVRRFELRAARVLCIAFLLGGLALGSLIPAAFLAPGDVDVQGRALLVVAGLAQTAFVAALLLWIQAALGERAEGLLVLIQTAVFCTVIVGAVVGLRALPHLALAESPGNELDAYPPFWFATFVLGAPARSTPDFAAALIAIGAAAITFAIAPFPPAPRSRSTRSPLSLLLVPARRIATALWVRREERAPFDLVYDALPAERDFVIRTYPLVAVPLAFLLMGAQAGDTHGEGLLAILLFTPPMYLPILLAHVPATSTPEARWLLDTAPLSAADERNGALKAVAVRFLLPLYLVLTLLAWQRGGFDLALRLALPGATAALLVMRHSWDIWVEGPPLSTAAKDLGSAWNEKWTGPLFGLAIFMTLLAILTWRLVTTPLVGIGIAVVVLIFELGLARKRKVAVGTLTK